MRRECPEISWGDWKILKTTESGVLIMRYEWHDHALLILHNFTPKPKAPRISCANAGDHILIDLLAKNDSRVEPSGSHVINLPPYAYRWYRAGGIDRNVAR